MILIFYSRKGPDIIIINTKKPKIIKQIKMHTVNNIRGNICVTHVKLYIEIINVRTQDTIRYKSIDSATLVGVCG